MSAYYIKKNRQSKPKSYNSNRSCGYPMSSTFIKACTAIPYTIQTINRHVNRLNTGGYINLTKQVEILFVGTLNDCFHFKKYAKEKDKCIIRKNKSDGLFSVRKFKPLIVHFIT